MNISPKKDFYISTIILIAYVIFFISLFFSFRAIINFSLAIWIVAGIIKRKRNPGKRPQPLWLLVGYALFFLLVIFSSLYTGTIQEAERNISLKSGLIFIPLAVLLAGPLDDQMQKKLLPGYCLPLAAAALYCLIAAGLNYTDTGDASVFFYHQLGKPLEQHAVYFSIFVFVGLLFLLQSTQKKYFIFNPVVSFSLIIFFSFFLFLLSSKLVISFYVLYLLYYFISLRKNNILDKRIITGLLAGTVILVTLVFITNNPISVRFRDIMNGDLALVERDKYTPGDYFNGAQFRLLQWKLVPEILNQHKSWWNGVGDANAQRFLDKEYISKNMYAGDPSTGRKGYPGYNTHNQFLESLLRYGIPGLLVFSFVFAALIRLAWQKKQREAAFIIVLLLVYALIESVFETQYGIILLTFFPLFLWQKE